MAMQSGFIKRIRDIMRMDAGINGDAQRIEQMVWMLFLKVYDAKEDDWELNEDNYESIIPEDLRWRNWAKADGNELELKIKQNELDKIAKEKEDSVLACVEVRFITVGKGKHRLKVWNSGNATAYNVSARFDGDVGIMIMDREKQPFEELEAGKSYELILITHNGFASKFRIITEWTDSSGKQHTKTQMGDFS